jgi:lipid II:glycine glycyltransferase (peptidoglycan interpeptide bridge formation enzyme)
MNKSSLERSSMLEINKSYSVEVDTVSKDKWYKIINNFSDANIYQTWSYDEIRFGRKKMSHLVIKKDDKIVSAVQVRIVKIPTIHAGIAYVFWGPLWKLKSIETDPDIFTQAIRALRNEYSQRRGLLLRIYPTLFSDESDIYVPILKNEGFTLSEREQPSRTLLVDLKPDLDIIRKGLDQKWRNCLNRSMKNDIELLEGDSKEMFDMFIALYRELLDRKKFAEPNDINEFRLIQENLPADYKMKILLCRYEDKICVGAIMATIGQTAVYLFGATNEIGMKSNGSYLIQWRFIEWLKQNNFACYNLHGINPVTNPGTYRFKAGLCGKNGKDVHFLGMFEACDNTLSALAVKYGDPLRLYYKKGKAGLREIRYILRNNLKHEETDLHPVKSNKN